MNHKEIKRISDELAELKKVVTPDSVDLLKHLDDNSVRRTNSLLAAICFITPLICATIMVVV